MPQGAAPRALLGVLVLILAIAMAVVPAVDARPKDKNDGNSDEVTTETPAGKDAAQTPDGSTTFVEQPLTTTGNGNERTLLDLDADGDYIPDALDNCPTVQNPDQADADGDGNGDVCTVYQDSDGDTVPDKQDNCPNVATSDFSDSDGDGVGDSCDKSPDGVEPESDPPPDHKGDSSKSDGTNGEGGDGTTEPPPPENGENQDGVEVERPGRARSKERTRTDMSKPTITTGSDQTGTGGDHRQDEPPADEPVRDNPHINEELIAEAAASGELDAPPEPPPSPQKAWDQEATADAGSWKSVLKIDAGATKDATTQSAGGSDQEPNDAKQSDGTRSANDAESGDEPGRDVGNNQFAYGWARAKQVLEAELRGESQVDDGQPDGDGKPEGDSNGSQAKVPVPVENGLVITGNENSKSKEKDASQEGKKPGEDEPSDGSPAGDAADRPPADGEAGKQKKAEQTEANTSKSDDAASGKDGSRRNGTSRGAAATAPSQAPDDGDAEPSDAKSPDKKAKKGDKGRKHGGVPKGWEDDRYFDGGSALDWSGDIEVAGTDDDALYLTQRSGSGPGKKRGFAYAIPVDGSGPYMVRLYFAEPYWGAPGGPDGEDGKRVFTVTAEGKPLFENLDVYTEAGSLTALVKQAEVDVQDGELNLRFTASAGEPIVAAIEILEPAG